MNISDLFFKILTPLLYFTASQQSDAVSTEMAKIDESTWDFPLNSTYKLRASAPIPYNGTLESGGWLGYEAGCNTFVDKNTNNTITPKFSFTYPDNTTPVTITAHCTPTIEPGHITVECSQLSFRHTHNVEVCIKNESDVHVLGVDCDAGL